VVGSHYAAGGKGVNVARVLKRYGIAVVVNGFCGGERGKEWMRFITQEGLRCQCVEVEGELRENITLLGPDIGEIHLLEEGPVVGKKEAEKLKEMVLEKVRGAGDMVVISGSLPAGLGAEFYMDIVREVEGRGAKAVVDTRGEILKEVLKVHPSIVKPNMKELEIICGKKFEKLDDVIEEIISLVRQGVVETVIVTCEQGACIASQGECYFVSAPDIEPVSTIGAGDALLGAFIAETLFDNPLDRALMAGVAAGTASCLTENPAEFSQEDYERIYSELVVRVV